MKKAYLKYILALLLFGSNGVIASHIALDSYRIVLLRTLVGGLFLLLLFIGTKGRFTALRDKRRLLCLLLSGAAMGASWMFLYEAYTRIGVSVATLAYYCGPVLLMAAAPLLFRERVTAKQWLGVAAVIAGMLCVNGRSLLQSGMSWGLICGILSAVTYAVMVVMSKKAGSGSGLEDTLWQLAAGLLVVAVFTTVRGGILFSIPQGSLVPILLLGVVNTGVGCYLYFSALPHLSAGSVAICGYLEPVSALAFSVLLLHEQLSPLQGVGTVLILGGAMFGELARSRDLSAGK